MSKGAINQRLKFLVGSLSPSIRAFSEAIGDSSSNTNNYIGSRQTEPKPEYLSKVINHFRQVNAHWLLTGDGEPFISDPLQTTTNTTHIKNNSGIGINNGTATQHITLEACQRELETARKDAAGYQREIALLEGQLKDKEDIITLLRASINSSK